MYRRKPLPLLTVIDGLVLAMSGIGAGLAFASRSHGVWLWILIAPLFAVLWSRRTGTLRGFLVTGLWGTGFFLTSYWFMTQLHPLTWRGLTTIESLLVAYGAAWLLLGLASAVGFGLLGAVLGLLRPVGWGRVWLPVAAWMIWEWLQRLGPLAMPWDVLAVSQIDYPAILQISALAGSVAVAGLIVAVNAGIGTAIADWRRQGCGGLRYLAIPLVLAGLNAFAGAWYLAGRPAIEAGRFKVGLVQGNVRPDVKWQPNALVGIFSTYARLTRAVAQDGVGLVVWPETAMPVQLHAYPALLDELKALSTETGVPVLVGALDRPPGSRGPYNGAVLVRPDGTLSSWYYKRHLVPFGEFLPGVGRLRGWLPQLNALPDDVQPGRDPGLIALGGLRLGPLVCYESIFPDLARRSVRAGADLLVVITNDAWYKRSIALHQHLAQAALRAVETRRPVVRVANTGISALIDPFGRIQGRTPIDLSTTLTGNVVPYGGETPYVRWGDWLVVVAAAGLAGGALASAWRQLRPAR